MRTVVSIAAGLSNTLGRVVGLQPIQAHPTGRVITDRYSLGCADIALLIKVDYIGSVQCMIMLVWPLFPVAQHHSKTCVCIVAGKGFLRGR